MTTPATPDARDVAHLWTLARLLVNEKQVAAAARCLELCVVAPASGEIALQANVLLAECCLALCQSEPKDAHRERWWKRYHCAERCVRTADEAAKSAGAARGWRARLFKCKYNVARFAKNDAITKNRQVVQVLCEAICWCCESIGLDSECDVLRVYFVAELRSSLVKMHAASMRIGQSPRASFEENLKLVRTSMPNVVDTSFQSWLIEVSCHVLVTSSRFRGATDAAKALEFADQWIDAQPKISPSLKQYHLLVKCLLLLRTGAIKNMIPLVDQLKALRVQQEGVSSAVSEFGDGPVLDNIVDALDLEIACRADTSEAIAISMKAIHQVQANLQSYAVGSEMHTFLVGLLFDMLYVHCDLQRQQCRFYEMGSSIAQLMKLYVAYKHHLELTLMLPHYISQIHTLVAKYSFAIGRQREGEAHVRSAMQKFIPAIRPNENAYPVHFVRLLVDLLDATMQCSAVADSAFMSAIRDHSNNIQVIQVCPTVAQLNLAAQILQSPNIRAVVQNCGNVELLAKYKLLVCKWLWATQVLSSRDATQGLHQQDTLETLRPDMGHLLHEALQDMTDHVKCSETTAEIMALYGSTLMETSRPENGEDTFKDALRISIHSKNVLLQARLLVDVFRVYTHRQLVEVQATTADKYEKKIQQLHRRIVQAQSEEDTVTKILSWSSGTT